MITVDVRNVELLYVRLKEGCQGEISRLHLEQKPVSQMITYISPRNDDYSLKTIVFPCFSIPSFDIEPARIQAQLPSYEAVKRSTFQVVLRHEGHEYHVQNSAGDGQKTITTQYPLNSPEEFSRQLQDYAQVLQAALNSFFPEQEIPDALYILGEQPPSGSPEREQMAHQGSPSLFSLLEGGKESDKLNQLERKIEVVDPQVPFEAIGGCRQGKQEMERIYADIVHPEIGRFFGREPESKKGYLLLGESGSGKTLLVKALATRVKQELGDLVKFYAADYHDLTSTWRGGEAIATGLLFELVKRNESQGQHTLLFLDELHTIGQRHPFYNEALDALLAELDGMTNYKRLTVIGATYQHLESLDPALIRPGRLSVQISILPPTVEERAEIFGIYFEKRQQQAAAAGNERLFAELDLHQLAEATDKFNGSHIAGIVEKVITQKEDAVKKLVGEQATLEQIQAGFTPLTQDEVLAAIRSYEKVERCSPTIGFTADPSRRKG